MSKTSFTRIRRESFRFSTEERVRLDGLTDAQVEAAAESDTDNPPMDDAQLRLMRRYRRITERE